MTTETKYICEFCGMKYEKEDECRNCENNHAIAGSVYESRYSNGFRYPDTVCINFNNGRKVIYKYLKPLITKTE